MSSARIPIIMLEIDQPFCAHSYGDSACGAELGIDGNQKCFNTFATCQSKEQYLPELLTLRFSQAHADVQSDKNIIPSLQTIKTSPARLNVGSRSSRDKPLGRRAELTATLMDHPHSDNIVDKYALERDYDPLTRSTFWAKWLKRNPFNQNYICRVREGFFGDTLEEMRTRTYVIDSISPPDSSGKVTLKALDILRISDDEKAQAPTLSRGTLLSEVSADETTSITITGGDLSHYTEYATNFVRISKEIIGYTSIALDSGGDIVISGLTRGAYNSEVSTHKEDSTVQACLLYDDVPPWQVARDLLQDFAQVDNSYIPYDEWEAEATVWLGGLTVTRLLTQPQGITTLLGELCEQCLFYIWYDEYDAKIKFKAVRPEVFNVPLISDNKNILQNSATLQTRPELRASEIWVSFLKTNPILDTKKRESYERTTARIDPTSSSEFEFGDRKVYEIFSEWVTSSALVDLLTFRLLARYRRPSTLIKFALDVKDRSLKIGDVFDLSYKAFVDETGLRDVIRYQVISSHESPPGEKILIEAQRFDFDATQRFGFWTADDYPDYSDADEEERLAGFFWCDEDGKVEGDDAYTWA
jgi:hypothetical protein